MEFLQVMYSPIFPLYSLVLMNYYYTGKAAPETFGNLSAEVLSFQALLKEAEETLFTRPLPPASQSRLETIGNGCRSVLEDLQALMDKYEGLGLQVKRTWNRLKWGNEDVSEVRARLISNSTLLTGFIR